MQNSEGVNVDLYIPRKCSATNRLVEAGDHAAVQIVVPELDENGHLTGKTTQYVLDGFLRSRALSDHALNQLATKDGFLANVVHKNQLL